MTDTDERAPRWTPDDHTTTDGEEPSTPRPSRSTRGAALVLAMLGMATLSFNSFRVAGWTVSDVFFLASGGVIMTKQLAGDQSRLMPSSWRAGSQLVLVGALVLLGFGTLSALRSWNPLASMLVVVRMAWATLVWFWIMRSVCRDRTALLSLIGAYQVSVMISAVVAVLADNGVAFTSHDFDAGRQPAFTYHPGELMNFLVSGFFFFAVPILVPRRGRAWPDRETKWWCAAVVLIVLAIFATGSTSALLALGVGSVAIASIALIAGSGPTRRRRSPGATMLLIAAVLIGVGALFASDAPLVERLNGYSNGSSGLDASVETRADANAEILGHFEDYLVVGIGPYFAGGAGAIATSAFAGEMEHGVHNMFVKILYEFGLIALVGLWIIVLATARQGYKLVVSTRGTDLYWVSLAMIGSLAAAVTSSMFGPTNYNRHYWLPFALISCLWALRRRELAAASAGTAGERTTVRRD